MSNDVNNESQENEEFVFEDEESSLNSVKDKLKELREVLKKCESEKREYLDGWQRAKADYINARKKDEKKRAELTQAIREEVLERILPVIDSFEMAFSNSDAWERVDENWRKGVEYIYSQLLSVLEGFDLYQLNPRGEKFDPSVHTSVEAVETGNIEEDETIAEVVQKGYEMNGRIVRSAKVKVFQYKK